MKRCKECRYFENENCKRYPPIIDNDNRFVWPTVIFNDWCGEFRHTEDYEYKRFLERDDPPY